MKRGIVDRIASAAGFTREGGNEVVGKSVSPPGSMVGDSLIYQSLRNMLNRGSSVTDPYSQSVWVYASVSKIATNISRVPLKFYRKDEGSKDGKVEVTEGPIVDLFKAPNPHMSSSQLIESTMSYLGISGEAFWILENENNVTKLPTEMWSFHPRRFEPVYDRKSNILLGWKYNGTNTVYFGLNEVVQFKYFNPNNDIRGMSPITAAMTSVNQDYYAGQYNEAFFKEGAVTSGFIVSKQPLNDIQYRRLREQFDDRHKGAQKAHRIGILEGETDFKENKMTQKDMDFIKSKEVTKKEIFAAYGTNDVVLGGYTDIKSYEGIKTAHKAFWEETLVPKINYVQTMINGMLSTIEGGRVWAEFDLGTVGALQEDLSDKANVAKEFIEMGFPLNAVNERLQLGFERVDWGDVAWMASSKVPVGSSEGYVAPSDDDDSKDDDEAKAKEDEKEKKDEKKSVDEFGFGAIEKSVKEAIDEEKLLERTMEIYTEDDVKLKVASKKREHVLLTKAVAELAWENYLLYQIPIEKKFKKKIERFFFEQKNAVLKQLYATFSKGIYDIVVKGTADDLLDEAEEVAKLRKFFKPLYSLSLETGAGAVFEEVGTGSFSFEPLSNDVLGYMEARLTKIPPSIVNTVKDGLRKTLTSGISKGESVHELAERVKQVYKVATTRATTIARTESASSISRGRQNEMKKHGIKRHRWLTAQDGEVRTTHGDLDGSVAVVGEKFQYVKGPGAGSFSKLAYPGDMSAPAGEVINCRCLTLAVIEEDVAISEEDVTTAALPPWKKAETWDDARKEFKSRFNVQELLSEGVPSKFKLKMANTIGEDMTRMFNDSPTMYKEYIDSGKRGALKHVKFHAGPNFVKNAGTSSGAQGVYKHSKKTIDVSAALPLEHKLSIGSGNWNTTSDLPGLFRHEFGHHLQLQKIGNAKQSVWKKWDDLYKDKGVSFFKSNVSSYGSTNRLESFAESFAAYTSPLYKKGSVGFKDVESVLKTIIPKN